MDPPGLLEVIVWLHIMSWVIQDIFHEQNKIYIYR